MQLNEPQWRPARAYNCLICLDVRLNARLVHWQKQLGGFLCLPFPGVPHQEGYVAMRRLLSKGVARIRAWECKNWPGPVEMGFRTLGKFYKAPVQRAPLNFTRISVEFLLDFHQNFTRILLEFHWKFTRILLLFRCPLDGCPLGALSGRGTFERQICLFRGLYKSYT